MYTQHVYISICIYIYTYICILLIYVSIPCFIDCSLQTKDVSESGRALNADHRNHKELPVVLSPKILASGPEGGTLPFAEMRTYFQYRGK